jgi:hypothetical protein
MPAKLSGGTELLEKVAQLSEMSTITGSKNILNGVTGPRIRPNINYLKREVRTF